MKTRKPIVINRPAKNVSERNSINTTSERKEKTKKTTIRAGCCLRKKV